MPAQVCGRNGEEIKMKLLSHNFQNNEIIPVIHTSEGKNISPHLAWSGAPRETDSFALILRNPNWPESQWIHWYIYDIPNYIFEISENAIICSAKILVNDFGRSCYLGPCKSPYDGYYIFQVCALRKFEKTYNTLRDMDKLKGNTLASAELIVRYP